MGWLPQTRHVGCRQIRSLDVVDSAMSFPDTFATARLCAQRLEPRHVAEILRMHEDPVQMATLGGVRDGTQTAEYMDRNLRHWAEFGFGVWILRDLDSNEVAGRALLRHVELNGHDEVEVGYSFHPQFWGRGFATEIAQACVNCGRDILRLPSIVALTLPNNLGSQRVMTKVGMVFEREITHEGLLHVLFRFRSHLDRSRSDEGAHRTEHG